MKRNLFGAIAMLLLAAVFLSGPAWAQLTAEKIFEPGQLKPTDSELKVAVGDMAPDITLPAVSGGSVSLSDYRGKKNVVLSFIPAAWTPVCSDQWPGYNIARGLFEAHDAVLLGISVDNIPTLYAWTREMGDLWFPVLSDFWPHGAVADRYGILRSDGVSERAIFIVDKQGILRYAHVSDINVRPGLGEIIHALEKVSGKSN